jgi:predicted alpha-1,6-mannanase (GH76 family)
MKRLELLFLLWACFVIGSLVDGASGASVVGNCTTHKGGSNSTHRCLLEGTRTLIHAFYEPLSGLLNTTGWWNSANALTTLANVGLAIGEQEGNWTVAHQVLEVLENTFRIHNNSHFADWYYDDDGWWALCWVAAFDLAEGIRLHAPRAPAPPKGSETVEAKDFLGAAEYLANVIGESWNASNCSGGLWWSMSKSYKNAIPNELYLQLTSALALRTANFSYMDRAKRELEWFRRSGLVNDENLINDGLVSETCQNNNGTVWSYNQGVILGGLVNLYRVEPDVQYLLYATVLADASMRALSVDGIVVEPCEPHCGGDGPQFKGVYLRNLGYLTSELRVWLKRNAGTGSPTFPILQDRHSRLVAFIARNGESVCQSDCAVLQFDEIYPPPASPEPIVKTGWFFGLEWRGPFDRRDGARQSSALDAVWSAYIYRE